MYTVVVVFVSRSDYNSKYVVLYTTNREYVSVVTL